ncbi:MAG: acetyl-CoA decarbonylase/synthase complex subunit delta [Chloroflexi bacterium]|nr:acetyl-CoA decarbonylase/synthase complex subunit delta [Chloroflexota bacterium]MCL5076105.1 acetyl-CoA decarbonylase/synthase complex subunit delta [Chloroflexota bacterium]
MTVQIPTEKWVGKVHEVQLGATSAEGGTRKRTVIVGGESTLPFLHFEGEIPHRPAIAIEIWDKKPAEWSPALLKVWGDLVNDVRRWAERAVQIGADIIALKLTPSKGEEKGYRGVKETVKTVLEAVDVPLIVYGPGIPEADNEMLVEVAEAGDGERLALGLCEDKNYRTIVAACLAHGHIAIGRAPIDVNIQKQLNILISDMGLPLDRILMDPTTGSLGYGLEYTYSVMERLRLAALQGDRMTQMPMICTVGEEAWRVKESKIPEGVPTAWGEFETRGVAWETITAATLLTAGADIVVLRHPQAVEAVKQTIEDLIAH